MRILKPGSVSAFARDPTRVATTLERSGSRRPTLYPSHGALARRDAPRWIDEALVVDFPQTG
jgi:hypothetical protein